MRVAAGDLLVRLDATQTQANLQMVSKQLDELRARIARLVAERDGLDRPQIPSELKARSSEDAVRSLLASEDSLFKARLNARTSQKDLLQSQVAQLSEEISGLEAQVASKAKQLGPDRGRNQRSSGPVRQTAGAADAAHHPAARDGADRR